eukprot:COSAG06_NODE_6704_length_2817_cov_6.132450_2_plen_150_part_00
MMILPRQARDKHQENLRNEIRFFSQAIEWRGQNPHRLSLGQLALRKILGGSDGSDGSNGTTATIDPAELTNINQTLDLWKGVAHSRFELAGSPVVVNTTVHGDADMVSTSIDTPLVAEGKLGVALSFGGGTCSGECTLETAESSAIRVS